MFKLIDLFAGIGGIRLAAERNGGQCVFSSEWDKHAAKSYEAFFGDYPHGDITKIVADSIPDFDMLCAGFPCQPFSIVGGQDGFGHTQGTLFFEIERILHARKPKCFLLENVKNLVSHAGGATMATILECLKRAGYHTHWKVLNALDYGLPQKRERIVIVGFRDEVNFEWPSPLPSAPRLADVLDSDASVSLKHFASMAVQASVLERLAGKVLPDRPWICHENKSRNVSPLPYACALRAGASYNYLLVNGIRRLTPREMLRLQGFPSGFPIVVSDGQIRKQCGNSVPVPMIQAVLRQMLPFIKERC